VPRRFPQRGEPRLTLLRRKRLARVAEQLALQRPNAGQVAVRPQQPDEQHEPDGQASPPEAAPSRSREQFHESSFLYWQWPSAYANTRSLGVPATLWTGSKSYASQICSEGTSFQAARSSSNVCPDGPRLG